MSPSRVNDNNTSNLEEQQEQDQILEREQKHKNKNKTGFTHPYLTMLIKAAEAEQARNQHTRSHRTVATYDQERIFVEEEDELELEHEYEQGHWLWREIPVSKPKSQSTSSQGEEKAQLGVRSTETGNSREKETVPVKTRVTEVWWKTFPGPVNKT